MNRRTLLFAAAPVTAIALFGCAKTPDQISSDVQLFVNGASAIVNALRAPNLKVPAGVLDQAQGALDDILKNKDAIGASLSQSNAPLADKISADVQTLSNLAQPYFGDSGYYASVLLAVVSLGSVIVASMSAKASLGSPKMSPAEARAVLAGVH